MCELDKYGGGGVPILIIFLYQTQNLGDIIMMIKIIIFKFKIELQKN